jgi:hypothetical protein
MNWDNVKTTDFREDRGKSPPGQRELVSISHNLSCSQKIKNKLQGMEANGHVCKAKLHSVGGGTKQKLILKSGNVYRFYIYGN